MGILTRPYTLRIHSHSPLNSYPIETVKPHTLRIIQPMQVFLIIFTK